MEHAGSEHGVQKKRSGGCVNVDEVLSKVGGIRNRLPYIINDELVIARQQILSPYF
jgi:hypothetical protein